MDNQGKNHKQKVENLTIVQLNMQKSKAVTTNSIKDISELDADIFLLQEPYLVKGRVALIGSLQCFPQNETDYNLKTAIIIKNKNIDALLLSQHTNKFITTISAKTEDKEIIICSVYFPPDCDINEGLNLLQEVIHDFQNKPLLIAGDVNAKSPMWQSPQEDVRGYQLVEFLQLNDLASLNKSKTPTFNSQAGKSWIDVCIGNQKLIELNPESNTIDGRSISDHNYIITELKNLQTKNDKRTVKSNTDWDYFREMLLTKWKPFVIQDIRNKKDIDHVVERLEKTILEVYQETTNNKIINKSNPPWWSREIENKRRALRSAHKKFRKEKDQENKVNLHNQYKQELREYKKLINNSRTNAWREFCSSNSERPWAKPYKIANQKYKKALLPSSVKKTDGQFTKSIEETVTEILDSIFPKDEIDDDNEINKKIRENALNINNKIKDKMFTYNEVSKVINKINDKKAPGIDGISGKMVINAYRSIPTTFVTLYNCCLQKGFFPTNWKTALIKLLHKPNSDHSNPDNYRPISLLSIMGKVLDKLLINRISWFLQERKFFNKNQYGFLPSKSTTQAIEKVIQFIKIARDKKQHSLLLSLDFKGAFNHAWWPLIFDSLKKSDCPCNLFYLLKDYFKDRTAIYKSKNTITKINISRGCPQGSPSGPTLWNIIFNDFLNIKDLPKNSLLQAFADDAVLLIRHHNRDILKRMADETMEKINIWSQDHKLKININKSTFLIIGKKNPLKKKMSIKINQEKIKQSTSLKYLGIMFNDRFTWTDHVNYVYNKTLKAINNFRSITSNNWGLSPKASRILYLGAIEPSITYASQTWGYAINNSNIKKKLLSIQRLAALRITKGYRTSPTNATLVLARILPINIKILQIYCMDKIRNIDWKKENNIQIAMDKLKIPTDYEKIIKTIKENNTDFYRKQFKQHPAETFNVEFQYFHKKQTGISIYTDGSKTNHGTGASLVAYNQHNQKVYQAYYKLQKHCTNNQAEIFAIYKSLQFIQQNNNMNKIFNIISDSKAALFSLNKQESYSSIVIDMKEMIKNINKNNTIKFFWSPGHRRVIGNEIADFLAKKATIHDLNIVYNNIPYSYLKKETSEIAKKQWQKEWNEANTGRQTFQFVPSIEDFLQNRHFIIDSNLTQIMTGHGNLNAYLKRFGLKNDNKCNCQAGEIQDSQHLIFRCGKYDNQRSKLERTALTYGHNWPCRLQKLIEDKNLFKEFKNFLKNTEALKPNFQRD